MATMKSAEQTQHYWIRSSYSHALSNHYYPDSLTEIVHQPDVYELAFILSRLLGSHTIVDVGCGHGRKLIGGHPEFEIVGVDFGANIQRCRMAYSVGTWIEHDLDAEGEVPLAPIAWRNSTVVCSDVIEHVARPEVLLRKLRVALDEGAAAILISTPERDLTRGVEDSGPPQNPAHVREWSIREFDALLSEYGFSLRSTGLTRSDDATSSLSTILSVSTGSSDRLHACTRQLIEYVPSNCRPRPMSWDDRLRVAARLLIKGF